MNTYKARDFKVTTLEQLLMPVPRFWKYLTDAQKAGVLSHTMLIHAPPMRGKRWSGTEYTVAFEPPKVV